MRHLAILPLLVVLTAASCDLRIGNGDRDRRDSPTAPTTTLTAPPTIHLFAADATRLGPPNGALLDTILRWDVTGQETHCRIDSAGPPVQNVGNVALGGSVQVRPQVSRDYTLSCTNAAGTVIRVVSIIVG